MRSKRLTGITYRSVLLFGLILTLAWQFPPCHGEMLAYGAFSGVRVYVKSDATGAQTGESWANALREIDDGVALAAAAGVREVWVAQGTYLKPLALQSGVEVYGGFAGGETQRAARNPRLHPTLLDVSHASAGAPAPHAVLIRGVTDARLDGLTLTGASATAPGDDRGGGILCDNLPEANIWIVGCTLTGNSAAGAGGGVYATTSTAPRLVACTITANSSARGGGLALDGLGACVNDCTITLNTATRGGGFSGGAPGVTLRNCAILSNTASQGGGVAAEGALELRACRLEGNQALWGGGLACLAAGVVHADQCAITGNLATEAGGGIHYAGLADLSGGLLTACTLRGNRAALGGGLAAAAALTARGCLFYDNTATSGGALALLAAGTALSGDTISDNAAACGGGLYAAGLVGGALTNCLFSGNAGHAIYARAAAGGGLRLRHGLWNGNAPGDLFDGTATRTGAAALGALGPWNCGNLDGAPCLGADYHLLAGSAALGRGVAAGTMESDLDGEERPGADGVVDVGCDESSGTLVGTAPPDALPPVSWVEPLPAQQATAVFTLNIFAADDLSDVVRVRLYYRVNNGAWRQGAQVAMSAGQTVPLDFDSYQAGGDGRYDFYTVGVDQAGNAEAPPAAPDATTLVAVPFPDACVYVDAGASGSQSGESWDNALHSLGAAIDCAEAQGFRVIRVAAGTYVENIWPASGVTILGGYACQADGSWVRDPAAHPTVIRGIRTYYNLNLQPAVVTLENASNTRLDGLVITGGYCAAGGGLRIRACDASNVVSNCVITGNRATYAAGVLCDDGSLATLSGCRISGNTADLQGGGIAIDENAAPRLINCILSGNTAGLSGGGAYVANLSSPVLIHCTLTGNAAPVGSALACVTLANPPAGTTPPPRLLNSILSGNTGVALAELDAVSEPALQGCLFDANTGGDYLDEGTAVLRGATAIDGRPGAEGTNFDGAAALLAGSQGTWTAAGVYSSATNFTQLVDGAAAFPPGSLVGRLINPDASQALQGLIVANTTTTLQVLGDLGGVARRNGIYRILDFRPGEGSAALDRVATTSTASVDLDGLIRPLDLPGVGNDGTSVTADIGACEARPALEIRDAASGAVLGAVAVLHFGAWDPAAPQAAQFTLLLLNRGSTNLHFGLPAAACSGTDAADFAVANGFSTASLAAGASRLLRIGFTPSAMGPRQALLTLRTDDAAAPVREIVLDGLGSTQPLAITLDPAPQTLSLGGQVVFTVGAVGNGPLTYRWQKDGGDLSNGGRVAGADTAALTLTGVQEADEGVYRCVVSNTHETVSSAGARLALWRHTLHIEPAPGDPDPPAGDYVYTSGTLVTARVATPVLTDAPGTTRLVCRGWRGAGAARGDPAATLLTFVLDAPTTISWLWQRQYALYAATEDPARGSVSALEGVGLAGWMDEGSSVTLQAAPQPGYRFTGWSGGLQGLRNPVRFRMQQPVQTVAHFLDVSLPAATAIVLDGADPTSATQVRFLVAFNKDVSGVTAGDFAVRTTPGLTGATIGAVTGLGSQYAVTVNTGSGDGALFLDLIDRDTVTDTGGVPLGGAGLVNGDYINVDACTIDRTPPQIAIQLLSQKPTNQTELYFKLQLSEPPAADLRVQDLVLSGTLAAAGLSLEGSGTDYTATLREADPEANGTLGLRPGAWVRDRAGNPLGEVPPLLGTIRHLATLGVQPQPAAAWTLSGPEGLRLGGQGTRTIPQAVTGQYSIAWAPLAGWVAPTSQTLTLCRDQVTTLTGRYRDITPPLGAFTFAGGGRYTTTTAVLLKLAAYDAASGVSRVRLCNEGEAWGDWAPYLAEMPWTLPEGDGLKTVYAQFQDGDGNISGDVSRSVELDSVAPDYENVWTLPSAVRPGTVATIYITATEALASSPTLTVNGRAATLASHQGLDYAFTYAVTAADDEGDATIEVLGYDPAGNLGWSGYAYRLIIDKTPPISAVQGPGGTSRQRNLRVTWTSIDPGPGGDASGVQWIYLYWCCNGGAYHRVGPFDAFADGTDFDTMAYAGSGNYSFYSVAVDAAGNVENKLAGVPEYSVLVKPFSAVQEWQRYE